MRFNDPNKPKTIRTKVSEDLWRQFKSLVVSKGVSIADYLEWMITKEVNENKKWD